MSEKHFFRAAVVDDPGRRLSSLWQVWSVDNELYVSVQGLTDQFKSSLHSSGRFRHAFVSQRQSDLLQPVDADRAVFKWDPARRNHNPLLFQILIPDAGLGSNVDAQSAPDVVSLPRPSENEILVLSVYRVPNAAAVHIDSPAAILDSWTIPAGETIHITKHVDRQSVANTTTWLDFIEHQPIFAEVRGPNIDHDGRFDLRGYLILDLGDNVGRVLDFGVREFAMWATFARAPYE